MVEPTSAPPTEMTGAQVNGPPARRRRHRRDGRAWPRRHGAGYLRREESAGAKAGNINHALRAHRRAVRGRARLRPRARAALPRGDARLRSPTSACAFVQTPQYYANWDRGEVPGAAWGQQALFFGPIARGKDGHDAMFCCGTNVVFRRAALEQVGGFPADSVTEDFELSIRLHERGWRSRYVPEVLAHGLGPEDMASYVSQQQRWSRGCLSALPAVLRSKLPLRLKVQYLLSASYFLTGWTVLVYMSVPGRAAS